MMDEGSKGAMQWHPEGYQPLWSDNDIANDAKRASSNLTTQATIRACLLFMRHGYEAARATQAARIEQLERELADAKFESAERNKTIDAMMEDIEELNALAGWEPVEDGFKLTDEMDWTLTKRTLATGKWYITICGIDDDKKQQFAEYYLSHDYALCRRTGTGTQQEVTR